MIGIFFSVDRPDMRRIPAKIGPPDAEFLAMRIDPIPERFGGDATLCPRVALDAHNIGCKAVAITSVKAATMV